MLTSLQHFYVPLKLTPSHHTKQPKTKKMRTGKEASEAEKQGEEKGLFHPEYFDRVLLDPPCSGLGLILS